MLQRLKHLVPVAWRAPLRGVYTRARHAGWRHRCNVCGAALHRFLTHGIPPEPNFLCPVCRSKPPHRLCAFLYERRPQLFVDGGLLLHIAPEPGLGARLAGMARRHGMHYRSGDIRGVGEARLDILDLPLTDGSVHLFYCCHVLNALQDDRAAMREVFRVLHPDGVAILQVPAFHTGATTLETHGADERRAVFGDDGIYRIYTDADYRARLAATGFEVSVFSHDDLPASLVQRCQLKREFLHLCRKPQGTQS